MPTSRREPLRCLGVNAARRVRAAIGYTHPMDLEIEVLAYMRGALVRSFPAQGARANLLRLGDKGIIGVAADLSVEERRWAIAHELGHFETHAGVSFLGLCTGTDMLAAYRTSGREPEANAFAAELLLPEDICEPKCDVAVPSWGPIVEMAEELGVSVTAAGIRFVELTGERAAVVCMDDGVVQWTCATSDFGERPRRGMRVPKETEAYEYFMTRNVEEKPQTVCASAWLDDVDGAADLGEHVFPMPELRMALSLLWWKD
jgi:Zn-dependent peptidase ImmA (M78 family)